MHDTADRNPEGADLHVLRGALDPLPVGVVLFHPDGQVLVANRAARDTLGPLATRPLTDWPSEAGELPVLLTLRDGVPRQEVELCLPRPGGGSMPILASSRAVRGPGGDILQVVMSITPIPGQCKRRERDRKDQRIQAIAALTTGIAGPLNDALTAISGYCDLALSRLDDTDPLQGVVAEIRQAGERASLLSGRLVSHGRKELASPQVLDVDRWLATRVTALHGLLGDDIQLQVTPSAEGGHIEADPRLLQQVVADLLANACDAMPKGGRLSLSTSLVEDFDGDEDAIAGGAMRTWVAISVADTGGGVPDAVLRRMFEPFFTTKPDALGLGLATVDRVVRTQGGHVRVVNRRGEGVSIHLQFPLVAPVTNAEECAADDPPKTRSRRATVLLVEDDAVVRELVHQVLEMAQCRVIEARSGADATRLLDDWHGPPPDLLVCDLVLPGEDGGAVAVRLKDHLPGMKVLLMSGACHPGELPECLTTEHAAFLAKPFAPDTLRRRVKELLATEDMPSAEAHAEALVSLRPSA